MILQRLAEHYDRLVAESPGTPPFGYQLKEIPFIVRLSKDGNFLGIIDRREGSGKKKKAPLMMIPKEKKRSGKNAWQVANLLWDHPGYVFGMTQDEKKKETATKQHQSFLQEIDLLVQSENVPGLQLLKTFLIKRDWKGMEEDASWTELLESNANVTFEISGDDFPLCQLPSVRTFVSLRKEEGEDSKSRCLITGALAAPTRLHANLKGIPGAQSSGAALVSFNLSAFESHGWEQGDNAPVSSAAEFAYTTALQTLLSDPEHRFHFGGTTVIFWSQRSTPVESVIASLFSNHSTGEEEQGVDAVRALLQSVQSGVSPEALKSPFYILGLSPNAARIAVRFWHEGTAFEIAKNIQKWFTALEIVRSERESPFLQLGKLIRSTALEWKMDNVPPNLAGETLFAVLTGIKLPASLLQAVIRRIRAELGGVNYTRAALIKAIFIINHHKEVSVALNPENPNVGYQLGRLFAKLEQIQYFAQGSLNASIRERYYGSFSSTPISVFNTLLKLKNHHLVKLNKPGQKVNLERDLNEIMGKIDSVPRHLTIEEQAEFALGYYHQRQHQFTKTPNEGETHE